MPPDVRSSDDPPGELKCDVILVGALSSDSGPRLHGVASELDSKLDGALSAHLEDISFKAEVGDVAVVPTYEKVSPRSVAVCGLGGGHAVAPGAVRKAAGAAARRLAERKTVGLALHGDDEGATAAVEGFLLGGYRYTEFKTKSKPSKLTDLVVPGASNDAVEKGSVLAEATSLARDLINRPPSELTPEILAERCREIAAENDLECEVLDEKALAEKGFGGLLGVGRGSKNPPRLIEFRYRPDGASGKVVIVGKGVTFDSGGLSLKGPKNMEQMKTDMGGGAAVIGAMSALARLGVAVEVVGLIPATENLPGYDAIKPGDVLRHYGGKTSEVLNTDAEGRLILADTLAYAGEQEPDAVVDLATLTGSIMVALGAKRSGLFSNDDELAGALLSAAKASGERLWRMPLDDDFDSFLSSEIADIVNTSSSRYGGAIFAAMFLKRFVSDGVPWAHLDIAGPARAEASYEEVPKGGTGVGVRTLLAWLGSR